MKEVLQEKRLLLTVSPTAMGFNAAKFYSIQVWASIENQNLQYGNPLATTQPEPCSDILPGNPAGVRRYYDCQNATYWYWGIVAHDQTVTNGLYPGVLLALRNPYVSSPDQCRNLAHAVGQTQWGTGDFSAAC